MLNTSIETISGDALCTVIRRPFDAELAREQLKMGIPTIAEIADGERVVIIHACRAELGYVYDWHYHEHRLVADKAYKYAVTILPALPKYPKPEDAALLYRYASEGIFAEARYEHDANGWVSFDTTLNYIKRMTTKDAEFLFDPCEIAHAIDADGNRVEVAIKGE